MLLDRLHAHCHAHAAADAEGGEPLLRARTLHLMKEGGEDARARGAGTRAGNLLEHRFEDGMEPARADVVEVAFHLGRGPRDLLESVRGQYELVPVCRQKPGGLFCERRLGFPHL